MPGSYVALGWQSGHGQPSPPGDIPERRPRRGDGRCAGAADDPKRGTEYVEDGQRIEIARMQQLLAERD
jgi:hypothetical protein